VLDRFAGADSRAFAGTAARKEGAGARAGTDGGSGSGCCYHSARSDRGGHGEDDANCGTIRYVRPTDPTTASPSPSRSDSSPTAESNWNKPIESSPKASHAAAVSTGDEGPGSGTMSVFAITGGVLLVGFGILVFAFWSRNRLAGHW
jgi:hypothetical protein